MRGDGATDVLAQRYTNVIRLMRRSRPLQSSSPAWRDQMTKNLILWMLGVPISVLILLNVFGLI